MSYLILRNYTYLQQRLMKSDLQQIEPNSQSQVDFNGYPLTSQNPRPRFFISHSLPPRLSKQPFTLVS